MRLSLGCAFVVLGLGVALQALGCDREAPPRPEETPAREGPTRHELAAHQGTDAQESPQPTHAEEQELARLRAEAGIDPADPVANPGDLTAEVASFSTLDACVEAHALRDPLLGDAIDALGYDALVRDACRTLQALKTSDPKRCAPIAASPLRQECEAAVAAFLGKPAMCPLAATGEREEARDPVCLAWASRDDRLCKAALPGERNVCAALANSDPKRCGADAACVRKAMRYGSLAPKAGKEPKQPLPAASVRVTVHGAKGTSDPEITSADFADLAAAGAVVRKTDGTVRVSIGTRKSPLWPSWDAPAAEPRFFLEMTLSARDLHDASATLGVERATFDLLWPKLSSLSNATASGLTVDIGEVATDVGAPVTFHAIATIGTAPRAYEVRIDVATFVRDAIERQR